MFNNNLNQERRAEYNNLSDEEDGYYLPRNSADDNESRLTSRMAYKVTDILLYHKNRF